MGHYLKIVDDNIVEAPYKTKRGNTTIIGYNKKSNERVLLEDGYTEFEFPAFQYTIVSGNIVEKVDSLEQLEPITEGPLYVTKLQIRRAMRALGVENVLNSILASNDQFKNDWTDAQEIDLNDPMVQQIVTLGIISQETFDLIKNTILNDGNIPEEPQVEQEEEEEPQQEEPQQEEN